MELLTIRPLPIRSRIIRAITADPYGEVALDLEQALEIAESPGIRAYLSNKLAYAREDEKARFARKFRRWVRESGMTRAELAEYLGTSRSRLSTYESGKVTPSAITAEKVRMLGVNRRKYLAP